MQVLGSTIYMSGEFSFDTMVDILPLWQGIQKINFEQQEVIVHCEQITKGDSCFFALLVEMRRWAYQKQYSWKLKKLPKTLEGFLSAYGITDLLTNS
jgi:ABC-type transporter Mla MlaB component